MMEQDFEGIIQKGESEGRPDGPAKLGFFLTDVDGRTVKENADNVFVLVVHFDFEKIKEKDRKQWLREGDAEDVRNLRMTFQENRNCNFRSILSPKKEHLLKLLSSKENLLRLFSTNDVPSVFALFVLSHGERNGKIFTDDYSIEHRNEFVHFTTADVFEALKKTEFEGCLKLINFGPCRGELFDTLNQPADKDYDNRDSCLITFTPAMHNLVVFYSTVETTMALRSERGTWLVGKTCQVLDSMDKDKPLVNFFASIQSRIFRDSGVIVGGMKIGQTPELKIFPLEKHFCISKNLSVSSAGPVLTTDARKAKKASVETKTEFYSWKSEKQQNIRGRRAFIFFEEQNVDVEKMEKALSRKLDFVTSQRRLSQKNLDFYLREVCELEFDIGCVLTCLFGQVSENKDTNEVCVLVDGREVPVTDILHAFVGPNNDRWIGKPKIFFLVDQTALKHDNVPWHKSECQISATNHCGWLVFVLKNQDKFEELIEILQSEELKRGKSVQELVSNLLITKAEKTINLLNSTLHFLLDFPDWPRTFVKLDFSLQNASKVLSFDELLAEAKMSLKENRCWLLSSVAGAGKTTVLREIAYRLSKSEPEVNILRVSLPKHSSIYFSENCRVNEIGFLAKSTHFSTSEITGWIDKKSAIVFMDGFDEISQNHRDKVLKVSAALVEKGVCLWIGTRPHEAKAIQQRVENAVVVEIEPLSESKQVEFLQILSERNEDECKRFLGNFRNKDVLRNPLHLSLLADCNGVGNLYEIYDKVVRKKLEMCLVRKGYDKGNKTKFLDKMESALTLLRLIASRLVRNKNPVGPGVTMKDLEKVNDYGVATFQNGRVAFLHQTFAEFLAAQQFLKDLEEADSPLPLFENHNLQQCRNFVDMFYSTVKDKGDAEFHVENLLTFTKTRPYQLLNFACEENLAHIFSLLKPHISFSESNSSLFITDGVYLLLKAIGKGDTASQFLRMGIIKDDEQLGQILPELLQKTVMCNAIDFFLCLKEQFPNLPGLMRSQRGKINAGHLAVDTGKAELLDLLLENGADPNLLVGSKNVIFVACEKGKTSCLRVLLKYGAREANFYEKHDPLMVAIVYGHLELVKFLLEEENGAFKRNPETFEVDRFKLNGNAFHLAVSRGRREIAEYLLLKNPALKTIKNKQGESPLQLAVQNNQLTICQWLVSKVGVELDSLISSSKTGKHDALYLDYFLMLQNDVAQKDKSGKTALHCAVEHGHLDLVRELIERGADIGDIDEKGWNALHFACKFVENVPFELFTLFYSKNTLVYTEETFAGQTALHILFENCTRHSETARKLVLFLIEHDQLETGGITLRVAWDRQLALIDVLFKHEISEGRKGTKSSLHWAAEWNDEALLEKWIGLFHGELDGKDENGATALHLAAEKGHHAFLNRLLKYGADHDIDDKNGNTPLQVACARNFMEIASDLLSCNARVDWTDREGRTVLHHVARWNRTYYMNGMLERNVDVTARDNEGKNVMHYALKNFELVSLLHEKDVELAGQVTKDGSTSLHLAASEEIAVAGFEKSIQEVIQWLVEKINVDVDGINNAGQTALMLACEHGKVYAVKYLLDKNADVGKRDQEGRTVLHYATRSRAMDVLEIILSHEGIDLTLRDSEGQNVLHYALQDMAIVLFLHGKNGELAKEVANRGRTSLHLALEKSHVSLEVIRWLVEDIQLDVNVHNEDGETTLLLACERHKWAIVDFLLTQEGLQVNVCDRKGRSPLLFAARSGNSDIARKLLEHGADLNFRDGEGKNVMHHAVQHLEMVQLLHGRDSKLATQLTKDGKSCLHLAICDQKRSEEVALWLIKSTDVDLNATDAEFGSTALLLAVVKKKWGVVDLLLTRNVDLNRQDHQGKSALHHAAELGKFYLLQRLVKRGANLALKDKNGWNVLHCGLASIQMVKFLHKQNGELVLGVDNFRNTSLLVAIDCFEAVDEEIIRWLTAESGIDLNAKDCDGDSALLRACKQRKWNVVDILLTKDVNVNSTDREGTTALHCAAALGNVYLLQKLIEHGADWHWKDIEGRNVLHSALNSMEIVFFLHDLNNALVKEVANDGRTTLHLAIARGSPEVILWLINEIKVDLNESDASGETPLMLACRFQIWELVDLLLDKNVEISTQDNYGNSALQYAIQFECFDLVQTLLFLGADI
ncbi:Hypothetical predicted protein [Cloeon dipterum]|uniref:NACHT domain-containing protein n=1 Tax=Cloeon dipterum TaxID=197152 RepID=A0A8S1E4L1_9INSE|nr:Hypothetical predicted protein [Cloeon dipterum]